MRARFIDEGSGGTVQCADYLPSFLEQLAPDIEEFECLREIGRAIAIVADGTGADFQLASVSDTKDNGAPTSATPPWWTGSPGSQPAVFNTRWEHFLAIYKLSSRFCSGMRTVIKSRNKARAA